MKAAQPTAMRATGSAAGSPIEFGEIIERRRQVRRDRGAEFVESPKVRIERAPGHLGPVGHFFDGDRSNRLAGEEHARGLDDLRPALCAPLTADFRTPS